jgi:hypothetical protein
VKARIFADAAGSLNDWSPLIDATFVMPQTFPLRIVELNYNPNAQPGVPVAEDLEYIELLNTGAATINLDGVQIAGFASTPYAFANGLTLAAGARIVVARTPAVFTQFYGSTINLATTGYAIANLSNGGEQVVLLGPAGEELQKFTYSDDPPWPTAADGNGRSLEIVNPLGDPTLASSWRASYVVNGSPGVDGLPPTDLAGDFDGNDQVDGNDFLHWQRGLGTPVPNATPGDGDADGDRDVDGNDFLVWAGAYGERQVAPAVLANVSGGPSITAASIEWPEFAWIDADTASRRAKPAADRRRSIDLAFAALAANVDDSLLPFEPTGRAISRFVESRFSPKRRTPLDRHGSLATAGQPSFHTIVEMCSWDGPSFAG